MGKIRFSSLSDAVMQEVKPAAVVDKEKAERKVLHYAEWQKGCLAWAELVTDPRWFSGHSPELDPAWFTLNEKDRGKVGEIKEKKKCFFFFFN